MDLAPFAVVLGALALSALLTALAGWLGQRAGVVDEPGGRRLHSRPISRLGGLGLAVAFILAAVGLYLWAPLRPEHQRPILGVLAGAGVACLGGLADDRWQFKSGPQFALQFGVALIALLGTVWIQDVTLPFWGFTRFPWFVTYPLTILWIMGMMNTVNFLDGLDGLAAGVGAIAALLFALHSFRLEQKEIALYPLALAGACLGFLLFNFHPARVFLGSAGAMTLGYALGTLSILAPARVATALLVMAIPIADTAFQIYDRWRRGRSPMQGDRGHLHFRLSDLGLSQRQIVLGYWLFCAVFGLLALLIPTNYKLPALLALGVLVVALLRWLSTRDRKPSP
jgi:UDP-GlcNAc:undecaprenyl-phosphate GlcNAc-1-phosphate transferase